MSREDPPAPALIAADVKALLESLKARLGATVVGILDGAQGLLCVSSEASGAAFWKTFYGVACLPTDWGDWDLELLGAAYARVDCSCGAHRVEAFTIHDRWILSVVVATDSLAAGANSIIEQAIETLERLLPASHFGRAPPAPPGRGGSQGPADLGIPIWWIRNRGRA